MKKLIEKDGNFYLIEKREQEKIDKLLADFDGLIGNFVHNLKEIGKNRRMVFMKSKLTEPKFLGDMYTFIIDLPLKIYNGSYKLIVEVTPKKMEVKMEWHIRGEKTIINKASQKIKDMWNVKDVINKLRFVYDDMDEAIEYFDDKFSNPLG